MNSDKQTTPTRASRESTPRALAQFSDADLLDAWQRDGSREALAALVDRYAVMVLSVCRRRCRSAADADDAFQSTFLYLARSAGSIRRPSRLAGWLHRVAQRAAVATLRLGEHPAAAEIDVPDHPEDLLDRLTERHEASVLDEELSNLPEHYRAALVLHLLEGHSYHALAERFGTTVGAVRGHVQRGKKLLARQLRRRGVTPVLALAAVKSWTAPAATASEAGRSLCGGDSAGDFSGSTHDSLDLQSLLSDGASSMFPLSVTAGLAGTAGVLALLLIPGPPADGTAAKPVPVVEIPAAAVETVAPQQTVLAQQSEAQPATNAEAEADSTDSDKAGTASTGSGGMPSGGGSGYGMGSGGAGGGFGMGMAYAGTAGAASGGVDASASGEVAERARSALDEEVSLTYTGPLSGLPEQLSAAADDLPVLLDPRGLEIAEVEADSASVEVDVSDQPLRTALRRILLPLGLRAVIQDEGLVVTADFTTLTRRRIATDRWLGISPEVVERMEEALETQVSLSFIDTPLEQAIQQISDDVSVPVMLDRRALEEMGITPDMPVTFDASEISLRSAIEVFGSEYDLTYTVQGEVLLITTQDAAGSKLRSRIYWLEGTGVPRGQFDSITQSIQTTVAPDTWEALGGPSTMAPLSARRWSSCPR